jgi:hypothetical protein
MIDAVKGCSWRIWRGFDTETKLRTEKRSGTGAPRRWPPALHNLAANEVKPVVIVSLLTTDD